MITSLVLTVAYMEATVTHRIWVGTILPKNGYLPTIELLGQRDFIVRRTVHGIWFLTRKENCSLAFLAVVPKAKAHNEWLGQYHAFIPGPVSAEEVERAIRASGLFKLT
jgi:hypothetical protein